MNENAWDDVVPGVSTLENAELDLRLEEAVVQSQRSDKLICCFLSEVQKRKAYRDFGFSNVCDYASERFGFKERKTRYFLFLGRKLQELPELREALRSGKLGWCKAARIASVATRQDETMWVDSALSLSVQELDRRLRDGIDRMVSMLHFPVTEDLRVLWENGLEIARRVAGVEISPVQAFEYMVAEFVATWANGGAPPDDEESKPESDEKEASVPVEAPRAADGAEVVAVEEPAADDRPPVEAKPLPLFPFAEKVEIQIQYPLLCFETGAPSTELETGRRRAFASSSSSATRGSAPIPDATRGGSFTFITSSSGATEVPTKPGTAPFSARSITACCMRDRSD